MEDTDHSMNEEETSPDVFGFRYNWRPWKTSLPANLLGASVTDCLVCLQPSPNHSVYYNKIKPDEAAVQFDPTAWHYDLSGEKLLVILNHHTFKKTKTFANKQPVTRTGTDSDVKNLIALFEGLGFKVENHKDLVYDKIMKTLREVASRNHTRTSCVCITILTHADEVGVLYAANRNYLLSDILTIFEKQPQLVNKPKLLLIQASKVKFIEDNPKTVHKDGEREVTVPTHTDFLILHSPVEDYIEKEEEIGSWMIQALCRIIAKYHTKLDLLQMITLMNRELVNTPSDQEMPETTFTLTKQLKF